MLYIILYVLFLYLKNVIIVIRCSRCCIPKYCLSFKYCRYYYTKLSVSNQICIMLQKKKTLITI